MINVMIVDDSAVARAVTLDALNLYTDINVIATASDPIFALQKMHKQWPDVLIVDIEMPRMDGITFLRQIMEERPTPTIIFSSLAEAGSDAVFQALQAGAVSILAKPKAGMSDFLGKDIADAVREAAGAKLRPSAIRSALQTKPNAKPVFTKTTTIERASTSAVTSRMSADVVLAPAVQHTDAQKNSLKNADKFIAIGTSTGGTQALECVLPRLPADAPGIVIVQHMPANFTRMFAQRLNSLCAIEVREAQTGDRIQNGVALIAPGGKHMVVKRVGTHYQVDIVDGPLVSRHKPSVDVLFRSVASVAGENAMGIIMTGMGDDGARGLKEMLLAGARTLAQDEQSSVVFGMPKEAILRDAAQTIVSLKSIPDVIVNFR
jgi:two-component system chemotaxis response regulator CheB